MRTNLSALLLGALLLCSTLEAATKKVINPPEFAPAPGAPAPMFSPGILDGDTLYVSGQIGQNLKTKDVPAEFEAEVQTTLDNIGIILKAGGMTFENVVSVQIYLTDMDLFPRMNAVYSKVFNSPRPSRTTVGVTKLANAKAHIEITVTARK
jgi:2-iminobutanoate/2-iminopropanoate deaminase